MKIFFCKIKISDLRNFLQLIKKEIHHVKMMYIVENKEYVNLIIMITINFSAHVLILMGSTVHIQRENYRF